MEIVTKKLPPNHNIAMGSDLHEGTIFQHEDGIDEFVDYVLSTPNTWALIGGDLAECMAIDDKRYDLKVMSKNQIPLNQYFSITKRLAPIKDRIIVCLFGNHDWELIRRIGNGVRDIFCRELKVRYGSYTSKVIIKDRKDQLMYKIYYTHGRKMVGSTADDPIRRDANMKLQLKRHLQNKAGDCLIMAKGHTHKLIVAKPAKELYLVDDGERVLQKYTYDVQHESYIDPDLRWYMNTGSFLKLYHEPIEQEDEHGNIEMIPVSGYAEQGEYDPVELGFAVIEVRDRQVTDVKKIVL